MAFGPLDPIFTKDEYRIKILLHKPKFQERVFALRAKWNIPEEGFTTQKAHDGWQIRMIGAGFNEYREDVRRLIREMDLTERWYRGMSEYIQLNAPYVLKRQTYEPVKVVRGAGGVIESTWIQVDRDTTQREIIEAYKTAKDILDAPDEKKQRPLPKNLDRDLEIFERHMDGESNVKIAAWLNATREESYNTDDVKSILKRIKRKLA